MSSAAANAALRTSSRDWKFTYPSVPLDDPVACALARTTRPMRCCAPSRAHRCPAALTEAVPARARRGVRAAEAAAAPVRAGVSVARIVAGGVWRRNVASEKVFFRRARRDARERRVRCARVCGPEGGPVRVTVFNCSSRALQF